MGKYTGINYHNINIKGLLLSSMGVLGRAAPSCLVLY